MEAVKLRDTRIKNINDEGDKLDEVFKIGEILKDECCMNEGTIRTVLSFLKKFNELDSKFRFLSRI